MLIVCRLERLCKLNWCDSEEEKNRVTVIDLTIQTHTRILTCMHARVSSYLEHVALVLLDSSGVALDLLLKSFDLIQFGRDFGLKACLGLLGAARVVC